MNALVAGRIVPPFHAPDSPWAMVWPLLMGLGIYLVVTAQPIGKPKPDLEEQLARLDIDERIRRQLAWRDVRPIFTSKLLEAMLRPILDDLGHLLRQVLTRLGVTGVRDLERKLQAVRPDVEPSQFFGEKIVSGLIGGGSFPLMQALGIHPFGTWPLIAWLGGFVAGFLAPDWYLEQRIAERRTRCLMELPALLDLLIIACSAGMALEQALTVVARQSQGAVAQELQRVSRELALGQATLVEALEAMADRLAVPEMTSFVSHLRAAFEQGIPVVQALAVQGETLREQKRLRIVEEGGKATTRMILPVAVLILPVLFVVLLFPAAVELIHLGG